MSIIHIRFADGVTEMMPMVYSLISFLGNTPYCDDQDKEFTFLTLQILIILIRWNNMIVIVITFRTYKLLEVAGKRQG